MNYRQQLNEYLQDNLGQSIAFDYTVEPVDSKFNITLKLAGLPFRSIQSVDNVKDGKEFVALGSLEQLRELKTEAEIRQLLHLAQVKRSPMINIIRQELRQIRRQLYRCGKKDAFKRLATIYPILDWVEKELTGSFSVASHLFERTTEE